VAVVVVIFVDKLNIDSTVLTPRSIWLTLAASCISLLFLIDDLMETYTPRDTTLCGSIVRTLMIVSMVVLVSLGR
jgi:hypothetical protein